MALPLRSFMSGIRLLNRTARPSTLDMLSVLVFLRDSHLIQDNALGLLGKLWKAGGGGGRRIIKLVK